MSHAHDDQTEQPALSATQRALLEKWKRAAKNRSTLPEIQVIPARQTDNAIPLSFAQQRLWILDQLEPGNAFYNAAIVLSLSGNLQWNTLEMSLQALIQRHESLRTVFTHENGQPIQVIDPVANSRLPLFDFSFLPSLQKNDEAHTLIKQEVQHHFDLACGPLLRTTLIRVDEQEHLLVLVMHHIIADGWSETILLEELATFYNAFSRKQPTHFAPLPIQTADFALWQRKWLQGEVLQKQLNYWKEHLADMPTKTDLPLDYPRPATQSYHGTRQSLQLPSRLSAQLKQLSQREGSTLFMTLLAAFQVLLYRYTGQADVVVGTPIANRGRSELEGLIGLFLNTLVIRSNLAGEPTFREALQRVRQGILNAFMHQDVPFEAIVAELQPERNLSHNALFQVMFVLQENGRKAFFMDGLSCTHLPVETETAKFDLTLEMMETDQGLLATIEYNTALFAPDTIKRLLGHWETLLVELSANLELPLTAYTLLTEAEKERQLVVWNATQKYYPEPHSLPELIERQVAMTPDRVALVFQDEQVSYAELDHRASQLACYLQQQGIRSDMLVGVCMERSIEMVVSLLGIIKAGAAYVPIDPSYPTERVTFMLHDSHVKILLTQQHLHAHLQSQVEHVLLLCLDHEWAQIMSSVGENNQPIRQLHPENLAYMIYTSGSTGIPKGAMNTHQAICNRLLWMQEAYQLNAGDSVLQKTPFSFDVSVWEFFWPLLTGAREVIALPEGHRDSHYLVSVIKEQAITTLHFVPSMLHIFLEAEEIEACTSIRTVICSGEALPYELQRRFFTRLNASLENLYGPTEAAVDVSSWSCSPFYEGSSVPIGHPIANLELYVLDPRLQPVPTGCIGELYIGGIGLARGYLDRADLTAEKFVPHPFHRHGARLYRTGDLARFLPDGNIVYAGRIDHQVKLRGFRIELGEIEKVLSAYKGIHECLVTVREEEKGEKRLVAYVTIQGQEQITSSLLRHYLHDRLPEYMVPAFFVMLEAFPLTPNGKVDHQALAKIKIVPDDGENFVEPRNLIEDRLATIWTEVLHLPRISVCANFFESGGDSILCMQIVARARQNGIHLTPRQFFQYQTIEELSRVATMSATQAIEAEQGAIIGTVPLTPIQHWFFEMELPYPQHWNQFMFVELQQNVDGRLLEHVCNALVIHHDGLRLRYLRGEQGWHQSSSIPGSLIHYVRIDLSRLSQAMQNSAISEIEEREQGLMRLDEGLLLRVVLFDLGSQRLQRLLLIVHHLGIDGVSWRILLEDLQQGYEQIVRGEEIRFPAKTTSFKHWAEQLVSYAQSTQVQEEQAYWLSAQNMKIKPLPIDIAGLATGNSAQSRKKVTTTLTRQETHALLEEVPQAYHTQINDLLLTALALTCASWNGSSLLRLDLEGHGREDLFAGIDLSRTIGWFTSLFPVLLDISEANTEIEALKLVKEQLRQIPRRGIGFGVLRYLSRAQKTLQAFQALPPSQLVFNYLGQFEPHSAPSSLLGLELHTSGLSQAPQGQRAYLLEVNSWIDQGQLQVTWEYSENCHHRSTIVGLAKKYIDTLCSLIVHCQSNENGGYTPSDFPEATLTQARLDAVLSEIDFGE